MRRFGLQPVTRRRDDKLARLNPGEFEELIARHYRKLGYTVERVGHGGYHFDGGVDLKLRRGAEYIVVQCKRENAYQVPHNVGHQLIGVMCTQSATGAIVVNTGEYTRHALESASAERRLTLVDGDEVRRWFPELAQPSTESQWEPVSSARERSKSGRSRRSGKEGEMALMGLAALIALVFWQCSRPEAVERAAAARVPVANPGSQVVEVVRPSPARQSGSTSSTGDSSALPTPEPAFQQLSQEELEEWKRGNEESMKILERTTPELPADPRGH